MWVRQGSFVKLGAMKRRDDATRTRLWVTTGRSNEGLCRYMGAGTHERFCWQAMHTSGAGVICSGWRKFA
jgi:hypothetical protein